MKNHNNFGNNHDISKSPPYTNSNHMKYHNSFNQNHNISNSPFYVNTKSLHDNTKGKALNDQNYFTVLYNIYIYYKRPYMHVYRD